MSWSKQRVYRCDVCGKRQPADMYNIEFEPAYWAHRGNRHGFTICDKCRDAIAWAADARDKERAERYKAAIDAIKRKEQEQEQGGEQEQKQELQAVVPLERYGGIVGALQTILYGGASDDKED